MFTCKTAGFDAFKKAVTSHAAGGRDRTRSKPPACAAAAGRVSPPASSGASCPTTIWPHYVVANADESEPGTFKDREILESNPYQFLEGLMIACLCRAGQRRLCLPARRVLADRRKSWMPASPSWKKPVYWATICLAANYSLRLYTHLGAGAYICGEETALLESIEGKLGQPRLRPPFPAVAGLYRQTDRDQQCGNPDQPAAHHRATARPGSAHCGTEKSPGRQDLQPFRLRQQTRQL